MDTRLLDSMLSFQVRIRHFYGHKIAWFYVIILGQNHTNLYGHAIAWIYVNNLGKDHTSLSRP